MILNASKFILLTVLFTPFYVIQAQNVSNVRASLEGDNINITYDLSGEAQSRYNVTLFASADGYNSPLLQVSGDIGPDIAPGNGKRVVWRAKSELGSFSGDLTFEIRAVPTFIPLRITRPTAGSTIKPGSSLGIRWEGGESNTNIKLELMKGGAIDRDIGTVNNTGTYSWSVPSSIVPGSGYSIRLYDTANALGAVESGSITFKAKSKGLWWKIGIPVVAAGALAAVLLSGGDDDPDPGGNGNGGGDELPTPPDTPTPGAGVTINSQLNFLNR